jgi:hypothetical protein
MDVGCSGCGTGAEPRGSLVVCTPADARRLLNWTRRYDAIIVALPALDFDGNRAAQSRLERYYFECGCAAGARAMIVALAVGPVAAWLSWPYPLAHLLRTLSIWFGVVLACTITAKMLAVLNARISLRCAIKELDGGIDLQSKSPCPSDNPLCR